MGIQVNGRDVIRLTDVDKVFLADDMETRALTHVSMSIREGEYVSIGGPSGCGKSTLLSIMGLLDEPTSGTVEIPR
jgi:ABC-type antimicrobial peptide transport system, ATPase component